MKDPRIDKLPRWARMEMGRLAANEVYYRAKLDELRLATSRVYIRDPGHENIHLPSDASYHFVIDAERGHEVAVRLTGDGGLEAQGTGGGSPMLVIEPRASNMFTVRGRRP